MDERADTVVIENCNRCGCVMDVSAHPPFALVACPECGEQVNVKCLVGGYRLTSTHGVGGMSLVFAAEDVTLGRKAAIKLLNEENSNDQKRIAEFEKEAKITAAISHPNVVRVFTVGRAFGRYFIAMELIEGASLEQLMLSQGALDEKMVTRLAIEIVLGLQSAQRAGLIHRDMKPGNVLLDSKGHAKIVDFGLALVTQGGTARAQEIWATPFYTPPESLCLQDEDLRSDIYALGATLYHAVSGKQPFSTETRSTSELIKIKASIPKLEEISDTVSLCLCKVIDKMMSYSAGQRYQDYTELLIALRKVESFHHTGVEPSACESLPSVKSNTLTQLARASILGGVLLVAGAAVYFPGQGEEVEPALLEVEPSVAFPALDEDAEARKVLLGAELRNAMNLFQQKDFNQAYKQYLKLAENDGVEAETAHWASIQAAICAWVLGDRTMAESALGSVSRENVSKQSEIEGSEPSQVQLRLRDAAQHLLQREPMDPQQFETVEDNIDAMLLLASALKEWEQGRWETAAPLFSKMVDTQTVESYLQADTYRSIAESYLHDHQRLLPFVDAEAPRSAAAVKAQAALVTEAGEGLKTQGKARRRVQEWIEKCTAAEQQFLQQEQLKKDAIAEGKRRSEAQWARAKKKAQSAFDLHMYAELQRVLQSAKPTDEQSTSWRSDKLYICEQILGLYAATFQALEGKSARFFIQRADGFGDYQRLLGATSKGLKVEGALNDEVLLSWQELSPQTMIELHAKIKTTRLSEAEQLLRREQLTIYAWRSGLKGKAAVWAKTLSAHSPSFSERWMRLNSAAPEAQDRE